MSETLASLFEKKGQLRRLIDDRTREVTRLRIWLEGAQKKFKLVSRVSEVWDGLPIEILEDGHRMASLSESGQWIRGASIHIDDQSGKNGLPSIWCLVINEYNPLEKAGPWSRWFQGKDSGLTLSSHEEALGFAREWILKGTVQGEVLTGGAKF